MAALFGKNATLKGISVGSRAQQVDMIRAIELNGIEPVIDLSYPPRPSAPPLNAGARVPRTKPGEAVRRTR